MIKNTPKYNLVHTYVDGATFKNIFDGNSPTQYGSILHIQYMTPTMLHRWPWMKNKWVLSNQQGTIAYCLTLKEAKSIAKTRWPDCTFTTPAQCRKGKIFA